MSNSVAIIGVGMTPFGKHSSSTYLDLGREAGMQAVKDAGILPGEIEAAYSANAMASIYFGASTIGQSIFWEMGIKGIPIINIENACTSSSAAFHQAYLAILSGVYDLVLVLGTEKMYDAQQGMISSGTAELEPELGFYIPANFALRAKAHMLKFGTTREQMAKVAVKNHLHGSLNKLSHYQKPISLEEVLNSPMIAEPLTKLDCCPKSDGAAAVVLCRGEIAHRYTSHPIWVSSSILGSGNYENPPNLERWELDYQTAQKAYKQAGIGPDEVDLAEVHDAFTIAEILHYEGLGFCNPGEGGLLIERGETALGGRIPVNTSGGLLAKGHPLGATGVAQLVELVLQLRGCCGKRQVAGAKVGIAHCMGGDKHGDAKSITIHIINT